MIGIQYDRKRLIALGKHDDFVVGDGAHIKRRNTGIPYLFREFAFPFIVSKAARNHGAPARIFCDTRKKIRDGRPIARRVNLVDVIDKKRGSAAAAQLVEKFVARYLDSQSCAP